VIQLLVDGLRVRVRGIGVGVGIGIDCHVDCEAVEVLDQIVYHYSSAARASE